MSEGATMIGIFLGIFLLISIPFAALKIAPEAPYYFGYVTVNDEQFADIELENIDTVPLHICDIYISQGFPTFQLVQDNCKGNTLNFGDKCNLRISFSPKLKEFYSGEIAIFYDDDGDSTKCNTKKLLRYALDGKGIAVRVVKTLPEPVTKGNIVEFPQTDYGSYSKISLRVCNAAPEPLVIQNVHFGDYPDNNAFRIVRNTCNGAYQVYTPDNDLCDKNYCEIELLFSPQEGITYGKDLYMGNLIIETSNGGPANKPYSHVVYLRGTTVLPDEYIYAPVGGEATTLVNANFTCPDNGNGIPGETIPIGSTIAYASGDYFSVIRTTCPNQCVEGVNYSCNVLIKFAPKTPGIYTSTITLALPLGASQNNVVKTIVGVAGSLTTRYINVEPKSIKFNNVRKLGYYEAYVELWNTSSSKLEMDVKTVGRGFYIKKVSCNCNDLPETPYPDFYYDGTQCVPNIDKTKDYYPTSVRHYLIRPGEKCSVSLIFSPPLISQEFNYSGSLLIDTPAEVVSVPLQAQGNVPQPAVSNPSNLPSFGSGSGGGCSSGNYAMVLQILIFVYVIKSIFKLLIKYNKRHA